MTGLDRTSTANDWLGNDYGDDLVYSAESTVEELKAVIRNATRATDADKFRALQILREAQELLNEAITECTI